MTATLEERFRQAAEAEGGEPVSAGAGSRMSGWLWPQAAPCMSICPAFPKPNGPS